jgi:hypothetical protein
MHSHPNGLLIGWQRGVKIETETKQRTALFHGINVLIDLVLVPGR